MLARFYFVLLCLAGATTGRPYNFTGCKTAERNCFETGRDKHLAEEHLRYIYENPMRWYYDELYTEE